MSWRSRSPLAPNRPNPDRVAIDMAAVDSTRRGHTAGALSRWADARLHSRVVDVRVSGQLYVKLLPDGEPVQLTRDDFPKMGPVFSPDGTRIAYTINDGSSWDTWQVATLRGEPQRWLRNASGLSWITPDDLVFSEIKERATHGDRPVDRGTEPILAICKCPGRWSGMPPSIGGFSRSHTRACRSR